MGGRGASSATGRGGIANAVLGKNATERLREMSGGQYGLRWQGEAEIIVRADKLNGTAEVDRMRKDANFNRVGWITGKSVISPDLLRQWADGNKLMNYAAADRAKLQDAAKSILSRYDARDAAAFYRYGHMMHGVSGR